LKLAERTLVPAFGRPTPVVHYITTDPRVTTVCPICHRPYKQDEPTVLVELVKRIPLPDRDPPPPETSVRVHVCESCAAPIMRKQHEAIDGLISMLAKMAADHVLKHAYPPDDGDLSDAQLSVIQKQEPPGRMTNTSSLFEQAPRGKGSASKPKRRITSRR